VDDIGAMAGGLIARMRRHGAGAGGSVTRLAYTKPWRAAMAELEDWFAEIGLEVRVDAVGTRYGRLAGDRSEVVMSGSHVDSVSDGGAYDGILGVIMAACAVRSLAATHGPPTRTLEVFANCEEESSRFASNFWGSRALAGGIELDEPERLVDPDGVTIGAAMRACGLDPTRIPEARRTDLVAYVEPHIEQGSVLEQAGQVIGVVDLVVGVRGLGVSLTGVAGHAGTLPMAMRRDALAGAAEIILGAERVGRGLGPPAVVTVGQIEALPGGFNQVPGLARFTIDFRHPREEALDALEGDLRGLVSRVAAARGLEGEVSHRIGQPAIRFDDRVCATLEEACREADVAWRRMPSLAGHDAQLIGRLCPAAMLFVPSKDGLSHRPDEETQLDHIVSGIEVLARALFRLAYRP
jgi:allantoate deiminase